MRSKTVRKIIGTGNPNLCFVYKKLPAAPVIRINHGNTLTINLKNTLDNTGPKNTENCRSKTI
jgi:hypothetical protein